MHPTLSHTSTHAKRAQVTVISYLYHILPLLLDDPDSDVVMRDALDNMAVNIQFSCVADLMLLQYCPILLLL